MEILIVGANWNPRALLRAQLIEAGCDVIAVASWAEAEQLCTWQAYDPDVAAIDLEEADRPEATLAAVPCHISPDRVLVLTTPLVLDPSRTRALGFPHVVAKPYSIGDVVERLLKMARLGPKSAPR